MFLWFYLSNFIPWMRGQTSLPPRVTLLTFLIHLLPLLPPLPPAPYSVQPTHPPLWISSLLTPNFQAVLEHTHPSFIRPGREEKEGKTPLHSTLFPRKEMREKKKNKIVKSGHRDFSNQAPFLPASFFPYPYFFSLLFFLFFLLGKG